MAAYSVKRMAGGRYRIINTYTNDLLVASYETYEEADAVRNKLERQAARAGKKHFGIFGA